MSAADEGPATAPADAGDGPGAPLHEIAMRVARGEIDLGHAKALAVESRVTARLTLPYVRSVAAIASQFAAGHNPSAALIVADLLRTAVGALPDDEANGPARSVADLTWIRAVTAALPDTPDWRLYRGAREAGAGLLGRARARRDAQLARWTHSELGELHFQVLVRLVTTGAAAEGRWRIWYQQGNNQAGGLAPYPSPEAAFRRAARYFEHAASGASDADLAFAIKGQVQALDWQGRITGVPPVERMAELAGQALAFIDVAADPVSGTYLMGIRQQAGMPIDAAVFQRILEVPVEQLIERLGPTEALTVHLNLSKLIEPTDARLALALVERAAPAVVQAQDATSLGRHSNALIGTLIRTMFKGTVDNSAGTLAAAQDVRMRAEAEQWSLEQVAGALMVLARECPTRDEEGEGLRLLQAAEQIFPDAFRAYPAAMRFWRTALWSGDGVNRTRAGDLAGAFGSYANALREAIPLGFADFVTTHLDYLADVATRGSDETVLPLLGVIFEIGLDLEAVAGSIAVERLQQLCTWMVERQVSSGSANSNVLHLTWQVAKARRFSAAIRTGAAARRDADPVRDDLLDRIAALRAQVSLADEGNAPGRRLDAMRLQLAFTQDETPSAGASPAEQLANLQARFDQRLERALAALSRGREADVYGLEDLRQALDARTALLQLFLGEVGGQRAVFALLAAADGQWLSVVPDDERLMIEFLEKGRSARAYSYEEDVFLTRQAIADEDLEEAELAKYLHAAGGAFLHGSIGEALDQLRAAGCDHLVVVPHGPYHFAPLHLCAREARLLADDWTVTVLPTIEMARARQGDAPTRQGIASFGVSFSATNPFALAELPEAADEAARVARALGATAVVDDDVTEAAVLGALPRAQYVHLATHGAMNVDAPSFQYLVVTPGAGADGLLHAHELMRQDLRGVRLVSLSACETALGRVDRGDNPRGLPAALLLAGAESIVGTLWEVASDPARAFFVELYRGLAQQLSRRDAFRRAQMETRRRFPHPRDWGAFFMVGAWS